MLSANVFIKTLSTRATDCIRKGLPCIGVASRGLGAMPPQITHGHFVP